MGLLLLIQILRNIDYVLSHLMSAIIFLQEARRTTETVSTFSVFAEVLNVLRRVLWAWNLPLQHVSFFVELLLHLLYYKLDIN